MKIIILLSFCTITFALYTDIDDSLDMDAVVANPEELRKHMECYLDRQPCTNTMNTYKRHFKELLSNKCKDCSLIQKHKLEELLKVIETSYPDYLQQALAKYDPKRKYFDAFEKEMEKY